MSVTPSVHALEVTSRSGDTIRIPYWRLESGKPGPCLLLVAAQHGNEVQGAEVIRRFVNGPGKELVRGSVIAVPFANLPAVRERRPHIGMKPEQPYGAPASVKRNMNLCWPGNPRGSLPARLADAIRRHLLEEATHVLDLHCWTRCWAPAVLIREAPGLREIAASLGQRFVDIRPPTDRTLGGYACSTGRIGLSFEHSGQYLVDEKQVRGGLILVTNLAKIIGILERGQLQRVWSAVFSDECVQVPVTAPVDGLFVEAPDLHVCDHVRTGRLLGTILDAETLETHEVRAPLPGYLRAFGAHRANCDVAMPGLHPYVTAGETLAIIQRKKDKTGKRRRTRS